MRPFLTSGLWKFPGFFSLILPSIGNCTRGPNSRRAIRICVFWLFCTIALVRQVCAVTIVVGGFNSVNDPLGNPGVFTTARLIDPSAVQVPLPGVPIAANYRRLEDQVYNRAHNAAILNKPVTLIGYSHGATLVLRVAHRLSERLLHRNLTVVTIDRIAIGYPLTLSPHHDSVPNGVKSAFNIYQRMDAAYKGGLVKGAVNLNATGQVNFEYSVGPVANPMDQRFKQSPHHFAQNSDFVRRWVLSKFNRAYVPGLWHMQVTGSSTQPISFSSFYLFYAAGNGFEAKSWTLLKRFDRFTGFISSVSGEFVFPTYAAKCPKLGIRAATGEFHGRFPTYDKIDLDLQGQWPHYYPKNCRDAGLHDFTGEAHGSLSTPIVGQRANLQKWLRQKELNHPTSSILEQPEGLDAVPMPMM